jgi:hypothetical protein
VLYDGSQCTSKLATGGHDLLMQDGEIAYHKSLNYLENRSAFHSESGMLKLP